MPFIIIVLCRVIIWHEMEHPLCVKMTRQILPYFTLTINETLSDWTLKWQVTIMVKNYLSVFIVPMFL